MENLQNLIFENKKVAIFSADVETFWEVPTWKRFDVETFFKAKTFPRRHNVPMF